MINFRSTAPDQFTLSKMKSHDLVKMELQSILSWDGEKNSLHSKHPDQDDTKIINAIHKVK